MAQIDTKDKVTVSPPKNEKSSISKIKRDLIHFHIDNNDLSTDRGINANQIVDDTNNKTIAEAIPNEITKNEETKRKHKDWLLKAVISFLASILQVLCKYKIVQKNLFKWTELNSVRFYIIRKISTCQ